MFVSLYNLVDSFTSIFLDLPLENPSSCIQLVLLFARRLLTLLGRDGFHLFLFVTSLLQVVDLGSRPWLLKLMLIHLHFEIIFYQ